jgi:hypothetical protein
MAETGGTTGGATGTSNGIDQIYEMIEKMQQQSAEMLTAQQAMSMAATEISAVSSGQKTLSEALLSIARKFQLNNV